MQESTKFRFMVDHKQNYELKITNYAHGKRQ